MIKGLVMGLLQGIGALIFKVIYGTVAKTEDEKRKVTLFALVTLLWIAALLCSILGWDTPAFAIICLILVIAYPVVIFLLRKKYHSQNHDATATMSSNDSSSKEESSHISDDKDN